MGTFSSIKRTSTMKKSMLLLASILMLVSLLNMEISAEPVPVPEPRDFVLVPLDESYGEDGKDRAPMFRSASFPKSDDYADGKGSIPIYRSSLPANEAIKNLGKSGVGRRAQPEFRSGCCNKVKVSYSSSTYCSSSYGPR